MIYFLPYITSVFAVSWVWRLIFDPSTGFFNQLIVWFGIHSQNWLGVPKMVEYAYRFILERNPQAFESENWIKKWKSNMGEYTQKAEIIGLVRELVKSNDMYSVLCPPMILKKP